MKTVISNCCIKRSIRADISCGRYHKIYIFYAIFYKLNEFFLLLDVPENACLISFQQIKDRLKFEHEKKKDIEIRKALG